MKFDFCGRVDCPDWILAQLFHCSKLDLNIFSLICASVRETVLNDGKLDETGLFKQLGIYESEPARASLDIDDARACFAALNYIMTSACIHQVTTRQLGNELEQLGLESEHCQVVCRTLEEANSSRRMLAKLQADALLD